MNCDEFKNKVADLFDTTIDMQTKAECNQHMAECAECRTYYEELSETFKALQPQPAASKQKLLSSAISFGVLLQPLQDSCSAL